jgi:hypothetical protein
MKLVKYYRPAARFGLSRNCGSAKAPAMYRSPVRTLQNRLKSSKLHVGMNSFNTIRIIYEGDFFYYRLRRRVLPQAMSSETYRKITRLYLALKSQLILKKLLELSNVTNHKKNIVV